MSDELETLRAENARLREALRVADWALNTFLRSAEHTVFEDGLVIRITKSHKTVAEALSSTPSTAEWLREVKRKERERVRRHLDEQALVVAARAVRALGDE